MRASALFLLNGFALLAGCATPPAVTQRTPAPRQAVYLAKVLAMRPVSGGLALAQVLQALGEPPAGQPAATQEIVLLMPDGSVKSVVPPPGTAMATLMPGAGVIISEAQQLRIVAR